MNPSDRISVWAFNLAPQDLRDLYRGQEQPEWVAFVPKTIHGLDVERAIQEICGSVFRHVTEQGDVVYIGSSSLSDLKALVVSGNRPDK